MIVIMTSDLIVIQREEIELQDFYARVLRSQLEMLVISVIILLT